MSFYRCDSVKFSEGVTVVEFTCTSYGDDELASLFLRLRGDKTKDYMVGQEYRVTIQPPAPAPQPKG